MFMIWRQATLRVGHAIISFDSMAIATRRGYRVSPSRSIIIFPFAWDGLVWPACNWLVWLKVFSRSFRRFPRNWSWLIYNKHNRWTQPSTISSIDVFVSILKWCIHHKIHPDPRNPRIHPHRPHRRTLMNPAICITCALLFVLSRYFDDHLADLETKPRERFNRRICSIRRTSPGRWIRIFRLLIENNGWFCTCVGKRRFD